MDKSLSISNFKHVPKAFFLAVLFIIIFEIVNIRLDNRTYPYSYDGLRMKIKNELSQTKNLNYDVIIMGDCYGLMGLDPVQIESQTGLKTFNFATHAAQSIFSSYLLLKNYLAHNEAPQYIVMSYLPEVSILTKDILLQEHLSKLYDFIPGNTLEFVKEFGIPQTIKFMIPSLKHQPFLKNKLFPLQLTDSNVIEEFASNVHQKQGFYPTHNDGPYKGSFYLGGHRYKKPISPFFKRHLEQIFDLAKANDIQIIYTMYTAPPDWYAEYKRVGIWTRYFKYFNEIRKKYSNIQFHDPQQRLNQMSLYADTTHLNSRGTRILSDFISNLIKP